MNKINYNKITLENQSEKNIKKNKNEQNQLIKSKKHSLFIRNTKKY